MARVSVLEQKMQERAAYAVRGKNVEFEPESQGFWNTRVLVGFGMLA
jgi:hypothetical protein